MSENKQRRPGVIRRTLTYLSSLLQRPGDAERAEKEDEAKEVGFRHSWLAMLGSLFLAFIIWLAVMSGDNPGASGEFNDVPLRIDNKSGLSILSGGDLAVDLRVEGKRSVIRSVDISDIDVSIVIEEDTTPGRYTYDISVQLPGGLTLVESSMTQAMIYLDHTTSANVPIKVKLADYILQDSYEIAMSDITTAITSIRVTGPKTLLETIDCAQVSLSLGSVTRSITCIGALKLVDASGNPISSSYIRMAQSEVSVTIPVYKYRTITPSIRFKHGLFSEDNVKVEISPASFRVKGEADIIDQLSWEQVIDEKTITGNATVKYAIGFDESVQILDDFDEVSVTITHLSTATKPIVLQSSAITVEGAGNNSYEILTPSLTVNFRGDSELLERFGMSGFVARIDLTPYALAEGTLTVPLAFYIGGDYAGKVWEVGSYSVSIRITPAAPETQEPEVQEPVQ